VSSGQSTLKALLAMNGGASIAFLAFIGSAIEKESIPPDAGRLLISAMQFFITGTFLTVFAFGTIFLTNCLSSIERKTASNVMFGFTIFCGTLSLASFVWASVTAIQGFTAASDVLFRVGG